MEKKYDAEREFFIDEVIIFQSRLNQISKFILENNNDEVNVYKIKGLISDIKSKLYCIEDFYLQ